MPFNICLSKSGLKQKQGKRKLEAAFFFFKHFSLEWPIYYLLLFGVELEALSEGTSLGLMVLLTVQVHTLGVRDVLFLRVAKQTAGASRNNTLKLCSLLDSLTSQLRLILCLRGL